VRISFFNVLKPEVEYLVVITGSRRSIAAFLMEDILAIMNLLQRNIAPIMIGYGAPDMAAVFSPPSTISPPSPQVPQGMEWSPFD